MPTSPAGLRPPPPGPDITVHSREPLVYTVDGVADAAQCAALIKVARTKLEEPRLSGLTLDHDPQVRSGQLAWLAPDGDPVVARHVARISRLLGLVDHPTESVQVVRYRPGQQYVAHFDAYDLTTAAGRKCARAHGQRLVTALLYLHAPQAGGATTLHRLDLDIAPVAGRLLVFENTGPDIRRPHPKSLHAGCPVERGEKWIANLWFTRRLAPAPDAGP